MIKDELKYSYYEVSVAMDCIMEEVFVGYDISWTIEIVVAPENRREIDY